MRILTDKFGYVVAYATIGCDDWIEVDSPDDFDEELFNLEYESYRFENGKLIKDEDKLQAIQKQLLMDSLRDRREKECFNIINRGTLWYDRLTDDQKIEMDKWYSAWLDVMETLDIPKKPEWLEPPKGDTSK